MNTNIIDTETRKRKTEFVLSKIYNLPAIPRVVFEVSTMIEDPNVSIAHLSSVIAKDQGLVTKILSIANSPLYGLPRKVTTIEFAVVVLGLSNVKNVVTALSMIDAFKNMNDKYLNQQEYWLHCILTGAASKRIAEELGFRNSGEAFLAGLLHDLGVPVLHKYFHNEFVKIWDLKNNAGLDIITAEQEVIGMNHQEIGAYLLNKWNLPSILSEAVLHHHNPSESLDGKQLASLIHLADYMTQKLQIGNFVFDENITLDKSIVNTLNLGDEYYLEKFINSYSELFIHHSKIVRL